jgi:hypothetical protein
MPVEEAILVICEEKDVFQMREFLGEVQELAAKYEALGSMRVKFTEEL